MKTNYRYFKVYKLNNQLVDFGRVKISHESGKPLDAAKKLLSSICLYSGITNKLKCKAEFYIKETTKGSNKKIYGPYKGTFKKYEKPVIIERKDGSKVKHTIYPSIYKLKNKSTIQKGGGDYTYDPYNPFAEQNRRLKSYARSMDATKGMRYNTYIRELKNKRDELLKKSKLYNNGSYKKSQLKENINEIEKSIQGFKNELIKIEKKEQRSISQSTPKANGVLNVKQIKTHPLFEAVSKRNLNKIKSLLEKESTNIDLKNDTMSLEQENIDIDIDDINNNGKTPLIISINKYINDIKFRNNEIIEKDFLIINYLLDKGSKLNIKDKDENTALIIAVRNNIYEISKLLLDKGSDSNIQGKDKDTALIIAVRNNNYEISKLLLDKGSKPNIQGKDKDTALIIAVRNNNYEISELLLEKELNPNIQGKDKDTALIIAVRNNNYEISELLLNKGSNPNIKDKDENAALIIAINNRNYEISKLLLDKDADPNIKRKFEIPALIEAVTSKNLEISKLLLDKGADPDIKGANGSTALVYSIYRDIDEIFELLLEYEVDVNLGDDSNDTPLIIAAGLNLKFVSLLLLKGANVNDINKFGNTALINACSNKSPNIDIIKLLLDNDADVNIANHLGISPLMQTCLNDNCNIEIIQLLLDKGANVNHKRNNEKTALIEACLNQNIDINVIYLLLENNAILESVIPYINDVLNQVIKKKLLDLLLKENLITNNNYKKYINPVKNNTTTKKQEPTKKDSFFSRWFGSSRKSNPK